MLNICHEHRKVTTWGCPECRNERLKEITDKAIDETKAKIRAAFRDAPQVKVR
jgi:hypothetical protein